MSNPRWFVIIEFNGHASDLNVRDWTVVPYEEVDQTNLFDHYGHLEACGKREGLWDTGGCRGVFVMLENGMTVINDARWDYGTQTWIAWKNMTGTDWPRHE